MRKLKTLAVLHYIYGTFVCAGGSLVFVYLYHGMEVQPMFRDPVFQGVAWCVVACVEFVGMGVILSGRWISRLRNRNASLLMAALCCPSIPLGTLLGIYTFTVLLEDDVKEEYALRHGPLSPS